MRSLHRWPARLRHALPPLSHAFIVLVALLGSGCALFASANAAHSHITPCVRDPSFAVVDFGLAGASTGVVILTDAVDDSAAWMLVPATFVSSGLIGAISADRCRKRRRETAASPGSVYRAPPPLPLSTLPLATPDDLGLTPRAPTAPAVQLRLAPTYVDKLGPAPPAPAPAAPAATVDESSVTDTVPCTAQHYLECPEHQECRESVDQRARCVLRR